MIIPLYHSSEPWVLQLYMKATKNNGLACWTLSSTSWDFGIWTRPCGQSMCLPRGSVMVMVYGFCAFTALSASGGYWFFPRKPACHFLSRGSRRYKLMRRAGVHQQWIPHYNIYILICILYTHLTTSDNGKMWQSIRYLKHIWVCLEHSSQHVKASGFSIALRTAFLQWPRWWTCTHCPPWIKQCSA